MIVRLCGGPMSNKKPYIPNSYKDVSYSRKSNEYSSLKQVVQWNTHIQPNHIQNNSRTYITEKLEKSLAMEVNHPEVNYIFYDL